MSNSAVVQARHAEFINGISKVYRTLIDMNYLQPTEVSFGALVDFKVLRTLGLGDEAISLVGCLPYLSPGIRDQWSHSEDGIPIAPLSQALTYASDGLSELQDMRSVMNGMFQLRPHQIKIARCGSSEGEDAIYDLEDKSLTLWKLTDSADENGDPKAKGSAVDMLADWCYKLKSLKWLPWSNEDRLSVIPRPLEWDIDQADPDAIRSTYTMHHQGWQQAAPPHGQQSVDQMLLERSETTAAIRNAFMAKRRIYEDAGWGLSFDKDLFKCLQSEWNAGHRQVTDIREHGPRAANVYDLRCGQGLRDFYRETAGWHAV